MTSWITITPRLHQGVKVVNQVDSSKFRLLVNRICQSLQCESSIKIFSEEEEEKLLVSLDLNKEDLGLLLDTIKSLYTEAAYSLTKPGAMEAVMKDMLNVQDEKIVIFVNAWMTFGKGIIDNRRQKSIFPTQVKDINWSLNIESSSSVISKDVCPVALLQLGFTGDRNSTQTIEFHKKGLVQLYQSLEKIQSQIDSLK